MSDFGDGPYHGSNWPPLPEWVIKAFLVLYSSGLFIGAYLFLDALYRNDLEFIRKYRVWVSIATALWIIFVGDLVARLKKKKRALYGSLELGFAVISAIVSVIKIESNWGLLVAVSGSTLLAMKGYENIEAAAEANQKG